MNLVENGNGKCFAGIDNQALYSNGASNGEGKRERETLKRVAATTKHVMEFPQGELGTRRTREEKGQEKEQGKERDHVCTCCD
jgi:hypothetical protein